jgi:F1F0 ATPase subunit 2
MIDLVFLPLTLLMGIGLGLLYFGGLWLTVRQLSKTQNPVLLSLLSFWGRITISLVGFFLVMRWGENNLVIHLSICLTAFFWVRNRMVQVLSPHN